MEEEIGDGETHRGTNGRTTSRWGEYIPGVEKVTSGPPKPESG